MLQGNSLCYYLKQTKMALLFLLQNWRTGGWAGPARLVMVGEGRRWGNGEGG
jgi:hypothetical protein